MQTLSSALPHQTNTRAFPASINQFLLLRIEETGADVEIFETETRKQEEKFGAAKINPIKRLFNEGYLTFKEKSAGHNYQHQFEIANISHHARPNWDGTSVSSFSLSAKDGHCKDAQIKADQQVFFIKRKLSLITRETQYNNKTFEVVELKLPEILEMVFERQMAIRNVRKELRKTGYKTTDDIIKDRVKKICNFLLDIENCPK